MLPANMDWLTPDIMHAVSRSDVFVFEVPTDASSQETLNGLIAAHGACPRASRCAPCCRPILRPITTR